MSLTHFSLFSGIGGIDLAAEWAGFTTVGQCEMADYPTKVLEKHWPNVPRWRDVRDVTAESARAAGIGSVTLISGGYPCQPFSSAGQRKGEDDDRYLWPEMLRVIEEIGPAWVLGENVAGHVSLGLDNTLADLARIGYSCRSFVIPAAAIGARHRRDRVFIVAHSSSERRQQITRGTSCNESSHEGRITQDNNEPERYGQSDRQRNVADAYNTWQLQPQGSIQEFGRWTGNSGKNVRYSTGERFPDWAGGQMGQPEPITKFERPDGREVERDFRGVAHGVSSRVDRLKCLGNAVVPQQVYPILKAIADIERGMIVGD